MRANGTFTVKAFNPASLTPEPVIAAALPVGVAIIEKQFDGDFAGRLAIDPDGTHRIWLDFELS